MLKPKEKKYRLKYLLKDRLMPVQNNYTNINL